MTKKYTEEIVWSNATLERRKTDRRHADSRRKMSGEKMVLKVPNLRKENDRRSNDRRKKVKLIITGRAVEVVSNNKKPQ